MLCDGCRRTYIVSLETSLGIPHTLQHVILCKESSIHFNFPMQMAVISHMPTPNRFTKILILYLNSPCFDSSKASVNLTFINQTLFLEQENQGPIKLRDLIAT